MSSEAQLKQLWLGTEDVAIALADARDLYVSIPGGEKRFMQLARTYDHLRAVETALYEYLHDKRDRVSHEWDRVAFAMAYGAIENAKTVTEIARDEAERFMEL